MQGPSQDDEYVASQTVPQCCRNKSHPYCNYWESHPFEGSDQNFCVMCRRCEVGSSCDMTLRNLCTHHCKSYEIQVCFQGSARENLLDYSSMIHGSLFEDQSMWRKLKDGNKQVCRRINGAHWLHGACSDVETAELRLSIQE